MSIRWLGRDLGESILKTKAETPQRRQNTQHLAVATKKTRAMKQSVNSEADVEKPV